MMARRPRSATAASTRGVWCWVSWGKLPGEAGDELLEIVEAIETRRSRHARRQDHVVECQQLVIVRRRFLIVDVESHAAEPAGAQGFDQSVAVDDRRVGHVD